MENITEVNQDCENIEEEFLNISQIYQQENSKKNETQKQANFISFDNLNEALELEDEMKFEKNMLKSISESYENSKLNSKNVSTVEEFGTDTKRYKQKINDPKQQKKKSKNDPKIVNNQHHLDVIDEKDCNSGDEDRSNRTTKRNNGFKGYQCFNQCNVTMTEDEITPYIIGVKELHTKFATIKKTNKKI